MNINKELLAALSCSEKISLLSGADFWHTTAINHLNIPSVRLNYGFFGLGGDHEFHSFCLPAPATLAGSFNRKLIRELGHLVGNEAVKNEIQALIAVDLQSKRYPLAGKAFLTYSEDPFLTSELASNYLNGIKATKTKVIAKGFTALSQESYKRTIDVLVDEAALVNFYLKAFQLVLNQVAVDGVILGHNKINGVYASENKWLTSLLNEKWGYRGLLISEWGAINNRYQALKAGVDLEMPKSDAYTSASLNQYLNKPETDCSLVDQQLKKVLNFVRPVEQKTIRTMEQEKLLIKAVHESAVLLKNNQHILPLNEHEGILVLGRFASKPRIQALGSTHVNVSATKPFLTVLKEQHINYEYSHGYYFENDTPDATLIEEAVNLAKRQQPVIIFLGLTDSNENGSTDRKDLDLPTNQLALLTAVAEVNQRIVVVLIGGSVVNTDWDQQTQAILKVGLAGAGFAQGTFDLLFNRVNPSGKLTETYPLKLNDLPATPYFPQGPKYVSFNESQYVGYRYFSSVAKPVKYPFGYGLSYSKFEVKLLNYPREVTTTTDLVFEFEIFNLGPYAGQEVLQLYVSLPDSHLIRPKLELVGFEKFEIAAGESQIVSLTVPTYLLAKYLNPSAPAVIESGVYHFYTGLDLANACQVQINRTDLNETHYPTGYDYRTGLNFKTKNHQKLVTYPTSVNALTRVGEFDFNSTLNELKQTLIGRRFYKQLFKEFEKQHIYTKNKVVNQQIIHEILGQLPLRSLIKLTGSKYDLVYWQDFLMACNQNKWFSWLRKKYKKNAPVNFDSFEE